MKIDKIILHNFKGFEGTVELSGIGEVTPEQPIILLGGMNGAGKTSLLEATLLALYGRGNKTLYPTQGAKKEDYDAYIYSLVNNQEKERKVIRPVMWVQLELADVELAGISQNVKIRRKWILKEDRSIANEEVQILDQNGEKTRYVTEENYNEFITSELIPYGISQFFLFDGEKIQQFVQDEDKAFAASLEEALGLSLHRQLIDDLIITKRQITTEHNKDAEINVQVKNIETEIERLKTDKEQDEFRIEELSEEIARNNEKIEEIDLETKRITKISADDYESYIKKKAELNKEKDLLESEVGSTISEIPFAFMAQLCEQVKEQILHERKLQDFLGAQQALEPKIVRISEQLFEGDQPIPPISEFHQNYYTEKLKKILRHTLEEMPPELGGIDILHELSIGESNQIISRIDSVWASVSNLSKSVERLNEIAPQLNEIQRNQVRTNDPDVQKLYQEKGALQERNATLDREIVDILRPRIKASEDSITQKLRQLTEFEKKIEKHSSMKRQIDYCGSLIEALTEFSKRFRQQRVEKLELYTLEMLQKLARKADFVSRVQIVPDEHFAVRLYTGNNLLIDKTKLSAGEKELVALSLIWALGKLASRSLPLVIDTPLARLDSEHREHIVEGYYPNAGEQVIVLSTDTEVVGELYESLKPYVKKTFLIRKDTVSAGAKFVEGYFD